MILIGTGAQGKYVIDILSQSRQIPHLIFNLPGYNNNKQFYNKPVFEFNVDKIDEFQDCVIAAKDSYLKENIYQQIKDKHLVFSKVIHPKAYVSKYSKVGIGTIINANATVQIEAKIGSFCMIHSGVIVEHNCDIGNFVNLAPGATLAGGVIVGNHTKIYTGAIIGPNVRIGDQCVVGAGVELLHDLNSNTIIYNEPVQRQRSTT